MTGSAPSAAEQIGVIPENLYREPLEVLIADHFRALMVCRYMEALFENDRAPLAADEADAVRRYLENDLPTHVADEEESLFPLLRERVGEEDRALGPMLTLLSDEHRQHALLAAPLIEFLSSTASGEKRAARRLGAQLFVALQRRHMAWENDVLLPVARHCLLPADLARLGRSIAARHGANGSI